MPIRALKLSRFCRQGVQCKTTKPGLLTTSQLSLAFSWGGSLKTTKWLTPFFIQMRKLRRRGPWPPSGWVPELELCNLPGSPSTTPCCPSVRTHSFGHIIKITPSRCTHSGTGNCSKHFTDIDSFNPHNNPSLHFLAEDTEAQRSYMTRWTSNSYCSSTYYVPDCPK